MISDRVRCRPDDEGFALVFVMLVVFLAMALMTTATAALITQLTPTAETIKNSNAIAAAEAGIEDFLAQVNAKCPQSDGFVCTWLDTTNNLSSNASVTDPLNQRGTCVITTATAAGDCVNAGAADDPRESYIWSVVPATASTSNPRASGVARIKSVGQVPAPPGSTNKYVTATLVADIQATPSFTNFEYFTKYETFPSDFLTDFYRARNIQITSGADESNSQISGQGAGTLQWNGTCSTVGNSSCDPVHSVDICNDLYYPSPLGPGRGTDTAWSNSSGRRPSSAVMSAMGTDSSFAYYAETGSFAKSSGGSVAVTHNDVCDSTFEPNMYMNGPVYSQDAYLIDRGKDTGYAGSGCSSKSISMPVFCDWAYSTWNGVINGVQQPANTANGGYNRSYPNTDGQMATDLSPQPVYTTRRLSLPNDASSAAPLATCTYTGPTRILIKPSGTGSTGTAFVTSPMTSAGPGACYTSTGGFTSGGGVVDAQVPTNGAVIYVKNPAAGTPSAATYGNKIFNLTAGAPTASNTLTGAWTDNASYSSSQSCPTPADPAKRRNFDCETGKASPREDMASAISDAVNATMKAGAASVSAMKTNLTNAITTLFNPASLTPPTPFANGQGAYYQIAVGTPTSSAAAPTPPLSPADPFLQQPATSATGTTMSAAITISRITCTSTGPSCSATASNTIYSGTVTGTFGGTLTAGFPWFGKQPGDAGYDPAKTYTDPNNDVTQYLTNQGDAYVEGTLKGSMSIVAEHDIVATNDLLYSNPTLSSTSDGLALVAVHDVRAYRPETCTTDGAAGATTIGYCPNDLSGVYTLPTSWPIPSNYPANMYTSAAAPSMFSTGSQKIYATIFTLQGCFMVDNFYRGGQGQSITLTGGLYQNHRGPTSLPYQGRPYQGSTTKMPGAVLTYNYDNMRAGEQANGGMRVPWVPNPPDRPAGSTRIWNVTQIATGS